MLCVCERERERGVAYACMGVCTEIIVCVGSI